MYHEERKEEMEQGNVVWIEESRMEVWRCLVGSEFDEVLR